MFFKHALARSIYRTCYFYALFEKEKLKEDAYYKNDMLKINIQKTKTVK